ncbi:hypothetical protein EZV62_007367 [Acer yangbiense]|uniref:Uncharacterized protein n=1 Tax=Acer yangbiense TaxID=1000413 RepID=A0A5C7IBL9_9ROSI|nr:hypothetical protein EZV62_007367 [Acer yangbiense]
MVEIAISVAAKLAEFLVAPIVLPFSYIWNYKTNFQNLETEVGKLKVKQDEVQHLVDDARRNGEEIEQHVIDWLDTVKKKVDEVSSEIIQEKGEQVNMKCFKGFCPNPKKRYQHSRKALHKAKSVVGLQKEGNFEKVSYRTIPKETWIPSYKGYEAFESRMSTLENILNTLSNPDINMFSIYGVGGIGKTTLARAIAKHAEDNKLFDVIAFAEVSAVPDIRKIQGEIADMFGLTFREESVPGRASKLHKCLMEQKKKILLVLDNIWATLELDKVGIPFRNDCKVLLTARDLNALTLTGSQLNFSMDVLNDQEAWNLFSTTAGDCIEQKRDFQVLAKEVAKACGGLPIAIVTIAKALRNKNKFEWRNALQELKRPSSRTLEGVAGEAYSCIEFSYNQLKDEELRSIFLLCSAMGSTNNSSIGDLMKYGMGLRIFKGIDRIKEARDRVDTLVRKLKDASLLLNTRNNKSFSMHDVVRDVGRLIASRNQQVVIGMDDNVRRDWDDDDTLKTCTKISLHNISELPKELECQHLEFLYMQTEEDTLAIPDNFFTKMSKLRVLHLVGFDLSSLPTSLCLLENLRTMCIDKCKVQDIALIGELKKPEILSIYDDYHIMRLPEEVRKSTGLRLLDLSTCFRLKEIPQNFIASLTQLEELYLNSEYIRWEVQGGSNASLDELKCLPHLTVLEIQIPNTSVLSKGLFSNKLERYNIKLGHRSLNYELRKKWPKTTRKLELNLGNNCSCFEDILHKTPSVNSVLSALDRGEGFPKLKQLWVHHSSCFHTVADCSESEFYHPFPSLETLFLEELNNLEKIYKGQFGAEFLCQLRNIKVEKCDKLKNIFSFSTIRALPLEEIEVGDCANITEIFAIGKEEDIIHLKELRSMTLEGLSQLTSFCSINNSEVILEDTFSAIFNGKVPFPNLETMEISHMNDLEMIWHNQLAEDSFCSLKSVKVIECNKLLTIFKFNMLERFTRLESLFVHRCNSLEEIFDLQEGCFLKLEELYLTGDSLRLISQAQFSEHLIPKLKFLTVYFGESAVFPPDILWRFPNLEMLEFTHGSYEEIFSLEEVEKHEVLARDEGDVTKYKIIFSKLKTLILSSLSSLTNFCVENYTFEFPALEELEVVDCNKMEIFCPGIISTPKLNKGQEEVGSQQSPSEVICLKSDLRISGQDADLVKVGSQSLS